MKCLKRLFSNNVQRKRVNEEFGKFFLSLGSFGDPDCISDRAIMDPNIWWAIYGASTPLLQQLAMRLLGQPSSSSYCERNWSTYSFIHSMRRNKIQPQRAEDLVYVHNNLRLLSRRSPYYVEQATKMWDISPDTLVSVENTCMFKVASLSLDEPELEVMLMEELNDEGDLDN
ncbi:hypothetical protein AXF42_Ash017713 [Apostasia shenzhenica]|uniref:HAT C-terminal dimerisation domain-containing protein n=1 Tax=Apostasia shenzhenica TaxID=1088818 RepID=A0A2I0B640_9ASPA|nr:hypothetical protein AXF42_Ash017713 [Apostasia shenzhenica]